MIHFIFYSIEEAQKRESEKFRNHYGAVGFSYDENIPGANGDGSNPSKESGEPDMKEQQIEEPYNCPPELQQFVSNLQLPETDKQAHIIEKTAVFVARKGSQMEIVLKARQHNNPLFGFLTYDHALNPFYKEIVRLVTQGRYIPKPRQTVDKPTGTLFTEANESNKPIHEDEYELKLPKVDISNTPYASLISKFKKINETAAALAAANLAASATSDDQSRVATPEVINETDPPPSSDGLANDNAPDSFENNEKTVESENETPSPQSSCTEDEVVVNCETAIPPTVAVDNDDVSATTTNTTTTTTVDNSQPESTDPLSPEEYEHIYQEYYRHYYAHYYTHYTNQWTACGGLMKDEHEASIVQEAAKAAAIAAAAAVSVIQQTRLKTTTPVIFEPPMNDDQRGIINKMAEYVVRNGLEFEELVSRQKTEDPRFAFLKPDHPLHSYYMAKRKELDPDDSLTKAADNNFNNNFNDIPSPSKSPKIRCSRKRHSSDEEPYGPKVKSNSHKKSHSPDSHKRTKGDSDSRNSERQTSISFRLTRPIPPAKSQSAHNNNDDTSAEKAMDIIECAVREYSKSISKSSKRREKQLKKSNIRENDVKSKKRKHRSPNIHVIPGIPSPSSSSSSHSSPLHDDSPYSDRSHSHRSLNSNYNSASVSPANSSSQSPERHERSELVTNFQSPNSSASNVPSPYANNPQSPMESASHSNAHLTSNWPSCALDDLLVCRSHIHEPTSLLDFSADGYQATIPTEKDERLREERRKKAAQLVQQLKLTSSIMKTTSENNVTAAKPVTVTVTDIPSKKMTDRSGVSPPPAPDSVPAAVAHAVVANLKRRQEALEAEMKSRKKRHRSPPAAYALSRHRHTDRSPRRSPTPKWDSYDRTDFRERDDEYFKSKRKYHKKSHY
uniref:SURP motif domain-containing protein n=1 Tax=Trichobilharzia regenti TaxID=157069 RepID=A0AA85INL4_TRIRE|nr:unnamed protein product [Trichobilharzia regenti]